MSWKDALLEQNVQRKKKWTRLSVMGLNINKYNIGTKKTQKDAIWNDYEKDKL